MSSPEPHTLSPAARSTALFVARAMFYNGLVLALAFAAAAAALLIFKLGDIPLMNDRLIAGGVLVVLAVLSFVIGWAAKSRIARLKK